MVENKKSNYMICPECGEKASFSPCFVCRAPAGGIRRILKAQCPICKGTGVVIECETCTRRRRSQMEDEEILKKNPFRSHYDPKFKKYRR